MINIAQYKVRNGKLCGYDLRALEWREINIEDEETLHEIAYRLNVAEPLMGKLKQSN